MYRKVGGVPRSPGGWLGLCGPPHRRRAYRQRRGTFVPHGPLRRSDGKHRTVPLEDGRTIVHPQPAGQYPQIARFADGVFAADRTGTGGYRHPSRRGGRVAALDGARSMTARLL